MKLSNFLEGIQILRNYYADPDGYHIGAEHDEFFMHATDRPVDDKDVRRLVELGWFQPECGFEKAEDYQPDEAWSAFT